MVRYIWYRPTIKGPQYVNDQYHFTYASINICNWFFLLQRSCTDFIVFSSKMVIVVPARDKKKLSFISRNIED